MFQSRQENEQEKTEQEEIFEPSLKNNFFEFWGGNKKESELKSATYYACMLIRCNAFAKLPIKLKKWTEEGAEDAKKHNLYYLLKTRPNAYMTPHDLKWATEFQRLHYGNAFWVMDMKHGKVNTIYLLDSTAMQIVIDNVGILDEPNSVYYIYNDTKKGQLIYTSDEIVHFKNFAKNGLEGTSIRKYLCDTIESEQYATRMTKERYKTGLQDPIIVEYTGDFSPEMQNKIKRKFAQIGGTKNAGKVLPIPTEFKVKQLETKLVNNQFFEMRGLNAKQIQNGFGVKSFQLNDLEKITYNNIEQQNKVFYSDTLQNVIVSYEEEMNYKMLTRKEQDEGYYTKINVDSILRSDLTTRTQSYKEGINAGYMTIAEVRKKEDLPHIEGTDKLIIGNGASIFLEDLGKQYQGGEKNKDI